MQKKLTFFIAVILIIVTLTGCGTSSMYASGKDGYTTITFVDGISFGVVSSVARNATAITNMSSEMAYETNQTYLYKDGETAYFIFNMESLVCIAQKGTTFHFSEATDMKEALENNGNILGVWFDCPKRKASSRDEEKNGVYKCIIDANAQVSLTPDIYGDFSGQLATIEYQGEEWALYIGTIGKEGYEELNKDMQKTIGYMVQSMNLYTAAEMPEENPPAVSLGGAEEAVSGENAETAGSTETAETKPEETEAPAEDTTTEEPESESEPEPESEPDQSEQTEETDAETYKPTEEEPTEEIPVEEEEITVEVEEAEPEQEPENEAKPVEEDEAGSEEEVVEEEPETTPDEEEQTSEETPMIRPSINPFISQNNQKKVVYEDNQVYTTDIYSMLQVGKKASICMLSDNTVTEGVVKVSEVLTGQNAVQLIKRKCNEGTLKYAYFDAPDGCTWNAVHYIVEEGTGYVNVKLRGLDGENLRFRGIEYSQRTYDIPVSDKEFYSFYAVPNACPEYALEIGEGTINNKLISGYYHIQGN